METKVNLAEKLALLDGPFKPGIVGTMNDYKLAVVKVRGEFVWHSHEDTVVPRGVEHCPRAEEETHALLIEPEGMVNTGDAGGELTEPERRI